MAYLQIPSVFDIKMAEQLGDCARLNACGGKPSIVYQTKTDLVLYSGPNLSCTNIQKCTNTTEIFQNFNAAICPETITETIINAIINNTTLSELLCTEVIKKCVTCDDFKDCITCDVILDCTSTTTSTTTIDPCACITFSNIGTDSGLVYYDACPGSFASGIPLPAGAVVQVCGSNPRAGDGGPGFNPTWIIGDSCIKVGQFNVCSDECCTYTIERTGGGIIYIDFLNCFGYYNETLVIQESDPLPTFCAIQGQVFITGAATFLQKNCSCIPTCQCYEADATGGGNYTLRWLSCDGVDKAQSIFNEKYQICATPGTVNYSGTGSFTLKPLLTPCTLDTDCWETFEMEANEIDSFRFAVLTTTGKFAIEWEPGVFQFFYSAFSGGVTHTYPSTYTGLIKIKAPSLSYITRLIVTNPAFPSTPTNYVHIYGPEITKLINLSELDVGYQCNVRLFCNTTDLASTLTKLRIYKGNVQGDLQFLSSLLGDLQIYGTSTITGDIQNLPPNLVLCGIAGSNTLYGDLTTLPVTLNATLKTFQIYGQNTIDGNISGIAGCALLESFDLQGFNEAVGDIAAFSGLSNLEDCTVYGKNALSGDLSSISGLTLLKRFVIDNNDIYLIPGVVGNTITGSLLSLPPALVTFTVGKYNTIGGDLSGIPSTMKTFLIRQVAGAGGNVTGSLASITGIPMTEFSLVGGSHTFSGTITQLPSTLVRSYLDTDGIISGNLTNLPINIVSFTIISGNPGSICTYTPGRIWPSTMSTMVIYTPGAPAIPTLDNLVIDLANSTWVVITIPSTYGILLKGTLTNPAAIAAAATIAATPTNVVFF